MARLKGMQRVRGKIVKEDMAVIDDLDLLVVCWAQGVQENRWMASAGEMMYHLQMYGDLHMHS